MLALLYFLLTTFYMPSNSCLLYGYQKKTFLNNTQSSIWAYFINLISLLMTNLETISDLDRLAQRKIEEVRNQRLHTIFVGIAFSSLWDFTKCPVIEFLYLNNSLIYHYVRISLGFIPSMGFFRQGYWSGLPFPSPLDHVLSELIITHLSWVTLHGVAKSFIESCKPICHNKAVIHEGVWNTRAFDCVDHCGKFLKREYQTTLPVSWETYMWVKKQQLEPDMK